MSRTRQPYVDFYSMWSNRELLFTVVERDLRVRYKQAILGVTWAVLVPLIHMFVFTVVFTHIVPLETELPYPVYAYAGLVPWTLFAAGLTGATSSLTGNFALVTKVACPRVVFPVSAILVALIDFLFAMLVLFVLMLYFDIPIHWTALAFPAVVLVQLALMLGLGLLLAVGNLFYRDVRYLTGVVLTILMFSTSVVYPIERVGGTLGTVLKANPLTALLGAYRAVLLEGTLPLNLPFAWATAVSSLVLLGGWLVFRRAQPAFAEVI